MGKMGRVSTSLRKHSLVNEAVKSIRGMIERERWAAGSRLATETELIAELGVSRTVLREAINRLEAMGLVEVRHGQGMFVGDRDSLTACVALVRTALAITPRDLFQFMEFRIAVEVYAARQAARLATDRDITELELLLAEIDLEDKTDEEAIRADFSFHRKLIEISGNALMLNIVRVLQEFYLAAMARTTRRPRDRDVSRTLHESILEAVRARSPEAAEKAMQAHMVVTRARLESQAESLSGKPSSTVAETGADPDAVS